MSKFIDKIRAQLTGKEYKEIIPLSPLGVEIRSDEECSYLPSGNMKEYQIYVYYKFTSHCYLKDLNLLIKNAVRELKEEIYGDIRHRILKLERALYSRDIIEAEKEIRDILREVFD